MATRDDEAISIAEWDQAHGRWPELMRIVAELGQSAWVAFAAGFHRSSHLLVATHEQAIAGLLRFVVQEIGADEGRPAVTFGRRPLTEAKVLAFSVVPAYRRRASAARCNWPPSTTPPGWAAINCAPTAAAVTRPTTSSNCRWASACTRSCAATTLPASIS